MCSLFIYGNESKLKETVLYYAHKLDLLQINNGIFGKEKNKKNYELIAVMLF